MIQDQMQLGRDIQIFILYNVSQCQRSLVKYKLMSSIIDISDGEVSARLILLT